MKVNTVGNQSSHSWNGWQITILCRSLAAEKAAMEQKVQQEDNKNKRLSQYNEELMWKLKHSSEVVSALAALSQDLPGEYVFKYYKMK